MDSSVEASMRKENAHLREQLELMAEEMAARQKDLEEIKLMLRTSGRSALNTGSTNTSEGELEMSVSGCTVPWDGYACLMWTESSQARSAFEWGVCLLQSQKVPTLASKDAGCCIAIASACCRIDIGD